MLLNCHELYHVISGFFDARQNMICVEFVLADAAALMRHADMRLVNPNTFLFVRQNWVFVLPLEFFLLGWVPKNTIK